MVLNVLIDMTTRHIILLVSTGNFNSQETLFTSPIAIHTLIVNFKNTYKIYKLMSIDRNF